jgi:formylmethanofuran dehydrogenase subunit E
MATYFYQSNPNSTKQQWLSTVKVCQSCLSQKPKDTFRVVDGEELCKECYKDLQD